MEWKSYPRELPPSSGNYIASIRRPYADGIYFFSDTAFYDTKTNKWWKTDPFTDQNIHDQDITYMVVGWMSNWVTFMG